MLEKDDYGFAVSLEEFYSDAESFYSDPPSQDEPKLHPEDIELHQTGIMAVNKDNPDWIIMGDKKYSNAIQLVGIDSPGQTSFLAIAGYVKDLIRRV